MMIDVHTHILPGIDDGSRDTRESIGLLEAERRDGVETIVATPHFYASRISVDGFLERRRASLERLREKIAGRDDLPKILTGAEVYYFPGIGKADQVPRLTTQGTNTLLLEMPFAQWDESVLRDVEDLIREQKLTVVLAHAERYLSFQKDRACWDRLLSMDVLVQLNAEDVIAPNRFLWPGRKKRFCLEYIEGHDRFLLGSDCHNLKDRRPNLKAARDEIRRLFGQEKLSACDQAAKEVTR